MDFSGRSKSKVELNVAPLIDIVFLLLVFFMLASTFIRPESINLAIRAPSGVGEQSEQPILVHIGANGAIRLNGLVLTIQDLKQELLARSSLPQENRTITVQTQDDVSVFMTKASNQVIFKIGNYQLTTTLTQGNFPDFNSLIPESNSTSCIIPKSNFKSAVRSLGVLAKDGNGIIRLEISGTEENQKVSLSKKQIKYLIEQENFLSNIISLNIGGQTIKALPREVTYDILTDDPIHIDFLRIVKGAKIIIEIPVKFINNEKSPGLKKGGVLNIVRRKIELKCATENVPNELVVDLDGFGPTQRLAYEVTACAEPRTFTETMVTGPLGAWAHCRTLVPSDGMVELIEEITFEPPGGLAGLMLTASRIQESLESSFAHRHRRLREILEAE